ARIDGHVERSDGEGPRVDQFSAIPLNSYWVVEATPDAATQKQDLVYVQLSPGAAPLESLGGNDLNLCPPPILTEQGEPWNPTDDESPEHHPCVEPGGAPPNPHATSECLNNYDDDEDETRDVDGGEDFGQAALPIDEMCEHSDECQPGNGNPAHQHDLESGLNYAPVGAVAWCTANESTWLLDMKDRHRRFQQLLDTPAADGLYGEQGGISPDYGEWVSRPRARTAVWRTSKCWMLPDLDDARSCRGNKNSCGPFAW